MTTLDLLDVTPESLAGRSVSDLAAELARVRQARKDLAAYHDLIEDALAAAMPGRDMVVGGMHLTRRAGAKRSRWDHEALYGLLLARARSHRLVDEQTGEMEDPAEAALRHVRSAVQPSYWRTTPLREWGVPIDEYCTTTWGRRTVEITGG